MANNWLVNSLLQLYDFLLCSFCNNTYYYYGVKELFLERTDDSENLKEILGASNNFELCIAQKLYSMCGEAVGSSLSNFLKPYMVRHEDVLCAHDN
jgi:hypothetical protein